MSNSVMDSKKSLSIHEVKPSESASQRSDLDSVVASFNPLGAAAEAYARTLAYRIESKRLAIEMERVREQAKIANNLIDKSFRLHMEQLEHRRLAINRFFDTTQGELQRLHIERMQVLKMMDLSMKSTLQPGISIEERRLYKEMTVDLTATLATLGDGATRKLGELVKTLPPVNLPAGLLAE